MPESVFRTHPWPFFGHNRGRFSDTAVSVFRTHLWPFSDHDRVRFSDTIVSAFRFKNIFPAIFFWAAFKHLKPNVEKTVAEKRSRVGKVQTLGMRAGSHSEPLGPFHPCPFFGHHFFRFWFQISVFGEKKYGHRPKKTWPPPAKNNGSGTSLGRPPAASRTSIGGLWGFLGPGGGEFQEAPLGGSKGASFGAPIWSRLGTSIWKVQRVSKAVRNGCSKDFARVVFMTSQLNDFVASFWSFRGRLAGRPLALPSQMQCSWPLHFVTGAKVLMVVSATTCGNTQRT